MALVTRWTESVDRGCPWPEYPRPQLVRPRWVNLNGPWETAITEPGGDPVFDRTVLVPFPVGSALSGVEEPLRPDQRLAMRRRFEAPERAPGERLRLHFGAVDWACDVAVNGSVVGRHRGGFDPFHLDITDALVAGSAQELVVTITDPTDTGDQPVGKQTLQPFAIQYTAVAGIWQTVWLEPVPAVCIESVHACSRLADRTVTLHVVVSGAVEGYRVDAVVSGDGEDMATASGPVVDGRATVDLVLDVLRPWSPDDPFLHDLVVTVGSADDEVVDQVESYFGAREIAVVRDAEGRARLALNGRILFHLGLLDQGWWPDGLYTAPTDEALTYDIEATKAMGFNTIRKHVKVEPARWYWHADRLGVLVWQDMPSTRFDMLAFGAEMAEGTAPPDMDWATISPGRDPGGFRVELDAILDALMPFPSIVVWVPFNEAWGQHDTDATLAHVADRDPSRLVDGPSGWVDTGTGSMRDHHLYQDPHEFPGLEGDRPVVYGEYGGLKLAVDGHMWADRGWGYETTETAEELDAAYERLTGVIASLIPEGLAGAIYTQTTDVEGEINGMLTYDRAVEKIPTARLAAIHRTIWEHDGSTAGP
jgi:beta-galactosidase/beta-glucuronidase